MQLMWISDAAGDVKTLSITARKILLAVGALAFLFILIGFVLHFVGLKVAIEVRPELARSLGGVTTEAEQMRVESLYRERLASMQRALDESAQKMSQMEELKNRFMKGATPVQLRGRLDAKGGGQGGPLVPGLQKGEAENMPLTELLDRSADEFEQFQKAVAQAQKEWNHQFSWLEHLPTGMPIAGDFHIASGFGMRTDPFTRTLARHEGLDFTSHIGAPILATADGVVTRSGWEASYGNIVEVTHADGFMTRYGHISKIHVLHGQRVKRGERIADVGSTGRSTGPHLHYEIFHKGQVMNPVQLLQLKSS